MKVETLHDSVQIHAYRSGLGQPPLHRGISHQVAGFLQTELAHAVGVVRLTVRTEMASAVAIDLLPWPCAVQRSSANTLCLST